MPENNPQTEENVNNVIPTLENKDGAKGDEANSGDKTNQDYAAERLAAKAEKLRAENEALANKLKELERANMPDDEQLDAEFNELAMEKVIKGVDQAKFAKLPKSIQDRIIADPFKFVDQEGLEAAIERGSNRREKYSLAAKYAIKEIEALVEDDESTIENQPKIEKDPTISKTGNSEKLGGMSVGELMTLAQTDPEKFERIRKTMR